ncbi:hypothetical protein P5V15_004336 [Pogonomyrmex californicus]
MGTLLNGDRQSEIDHVYGVYFDMSGSMLGDRRFDVAADDSVIMGDAISGYPGLIRVDLQETSRVYGDDAMYTEYDKQTYKSILLTTNAH